MCGATENARISAMEAKIVEKPISKSELKALAEEGFGDMVKAVVDVEKKVMALGSELHAEAEILLTEQGSKREHVWGINIYPEKSGDEWIEFDSMVNIKPQFNNRSRNVEDPEIRAKITAIVNKLIT